MGKYFETSDPNLKHYPDICPEGVRKRRQCTNYVTLTRVRVTIVAKEEQ